ncbi:hypothetical protein PRK78_005922 [Emydomyces testavorans]|uniref:F-box domain-containing protein n=1 Tax=Emydomyces testavorans TaxID=2070801 RepID=A0AAF0DKG8_9EURO|nr:hypothetical protein PRK78_005922 [Emydomyces testavorans]
MVIYVDHARDAYPGFALQSLGDAKSLLSANVVAFKSSPGTKEPEPLPADHAAENGAANGNTEALRISDEETLDPIFLRFCTALGCYPVVKQLARCVDLNTLHALSRTCHQFREILLASRYQLMQETLRCRHDSVDEEEGHNKNARNDTLRAFRDAHWELVPGKMFWYTRLSSTSSGQTTNTFQNCTMKPPSATLLKSRLRRLCTTCLAAPLSDHLTSQSFASHDLQVDSTSPLSFTHSSCSCNDRVWFCRTCGPILRSDDTAYRRVFSWRTRYSAYLGGGLGTGIGDTCRGVQCGREDKCLAAEEIEVEIDCEVDDWVSEHSDHSNSHLGDNHHTEDEGPGYLRQEIMGVGGVVKNKVKKRVRVGASVEEHDDESESSVYLKRECSGEVRSWCGWCGRVVPGKSELDNL